MYDVIIVGARVAGATTAMLLARKGLKVLALDRAAFPSDTLSTHQIQLPGVARLARWGLLDRLVAAGTPAVRRLRFDPGPAVLAGALPAYDGVDAIYGPRRTLLDRVLVDAARDAGAEVRENAIVDGLLAGSGSVTGVTFKNSTVREEHARLVVGADGRNSLVARTVGAPRYREKPGLSMAYYAYWSGVPLSGGEIYARDRRAIGAWPTNDGLVITYVGAPVADFAAFRRDPEGNLLAALDLAGDLGGRVRAGHLVEHLRGTPELPNFFRRPYGPGWALVGDAGYVLDPITAQGIADALRDAELLADAVAAGFGGIRPLDRALAGYQRERDRAALPMYRFTTGLAAFRPPAVQEEVLFGAIEGHPERTERFLGVLSGAVPVGEYLTPGNLFRVIGARGMGKIALSKVRGR
jgi:2-polyprenyl-6-methoxyphenol hydroxylase-like FAD-dependent oxidoreductase